MRVNEKPINFILQDFSDTEEVAAISISSDSDLDMEQS